MSNHIHLKGFTEGENGLSSIIRDFKKFTAKEISKILLNEKIESRRKWMLKIFNEAGKKNNNNKEFQFWKQNNRPIELLSPKWINQKINYIHNNPVKAGLVDNSEDYIYSSARNYLGRDGLIDVEIIDLDNNIRYL